MKMNGHDSRGALLIALSLLLILGCSGKKEVGLPDAPHPVILINIGTLRADHLGCYGYDRATSPNIDSLAAESIHFEWAFSQAPMTGPSQASIFTGLYPSSHGMVQEGTRIPEQAVTLAEALSGLGCKTAAFVDGGYLSPGFGLEQGFEVYDNSQGGGLEAVGPKAIEWLRANASENFLLLVHTYDVHTPYDPPAGTRDLFLQGLAAPTEGFTPGVEEMEAVRASFETDSPAPLPENDVEYAKALYDAEIRAVDEWVGEFLQVIAELGLDQRATIVLFSDHGEEFQEHGSVLHEKLYATVTHVPLLVRLPSGFAAKSVPQVVEMIDVMPTLLELSGADSLPPMQGESLLPLIEGMGQPPYLAFSESPFFGGQQAVVMGGYHLIHTLESGQASLYSIAQDALEQNDLAGTEKDRVEVMMRHLESWGARLERFTIEGGEAASVGDETLEQLRSLGYVQ
jgi:arylsulfatase A-like enzyme